MVPPFPPFLSISHLSPLLSVQYMPPIDTQACTLSVAQVSSLTYSSTKHTYIHTYIRTYIHTYIHMHAHTCLWPLLSDVRGMLGIQRLHGWPYVLAICSVKVWHHFKCMNVLEGLWLLCASYEGSVLQHLMGRLCV